MKPGVAVTGESAPRVHVFGATQLEEDPDARLCSETDTGQTLVYHVEPRWVPLTTEWFCASCAMSTRSLEVT